MTYNSAYKITILVIATTGSLSLGYRIVGETRAIVTFADGMVPIRVDDGVAFFDPRSSKPKHQTHREPIGKEWSGQPHY